MVVYRVLAATVIASAFWTLAPASAQTATDKPLNLFDNKPVNPEVKSKTKRSAKPKAAKSGTAGTQSANQAGTEAWPNIKIVPVIVNRDTSSAMAESSTSMPVVSADEVNEIDLAAPVAASSVPAATTEGRASRDHVDAVTPSDASHAPMLAASRDIVPTMNPFVRFDWLGPLLMIMAGALTALSGYLLFTRGRRRYRPA